MTNTKMLEKAIYMATRAHMSQVDKGGQPYILHCLRVMFQGRTIEEQICGVLHDIIEDTRYRYIDLLISGISEEIVEAIRCLTKVKGESYDDYLKKVVTNELARKVKLNDISDNLNLNRLENPSDADYKRCERYTKAQVYLIQNRKR